MANVGSGGHQGTLEAWLICNSRISGSLSSSFVHQGPSWLRRQMSALWIVSVHYLFSLECWLHGGDLEAPSRERRPCDRHLIV